LSPTCNDGYWIDIGTPDKYTQVHRDIMDGRYAATPFRGLPRRARGRRGGRPVEPGATIDGPCFIDEA
jgi:NDP-sugar pyrophosphorylase family protein